MDHSEWSTLKYPTYNPSILTIRIRIFQRKRFPRPLTRNTFVVLALDETDHASTPSGVFVGFAVRVRTTWYVVTGVHASAANACEDVIAVVIGGALVLRNSDSGATSAVRIADGTSGAFADVIALGVDAVGVVAAGVVRALVHIHATVLGISFVTSLAHAPGRVARCAFCVDATWEPVARICNTQT